MTISALVVADSVGLKAPRLTTLLLRYPLIIHAELMTHRVFSRNAASMRAIPIERMIKEISTDPFVPMVWLKNQPGMQGYEELEPSTAEAAKAEWLRGLQLALGQVNRLRALGVHKQIVNRVLMPYAHITVLVTSTYWSNFFALRDHPAAEPHMRYLAQQMLWAMEGSKPKALAYGDWHMPFVGSEDWAAIRETHPYVSELPERQHVAHRGSDPSDAAIITQARMYAALRLSVARCASTSYRTVDGYEMTAERAQAVYDKMLGDSPIHASPAEHQAQVDQWVSHHWAAPHLRGNFAPGWRQFRKTLEHEAQMEDYG